MIARLKSFALILPCWLLVAPSSRAETPEEKILTELRQRVIDSRLKVLLAQAKLKALQLEEQIGKPARMSEATRLEMTDADALLGKVREELTIKHTDLMEQLMKLTAAADKRQVAALKSWEEANKHALELRLELERAKAFRAAEASRTSLFDGFLPLAITWGVFVFLIAILLILHERRISLRRWWRGTQHVAVVFAIALGVVSPSLAAPDDDELTRLEDEWYDLEKEHQALERKIRDIEIRIARNREAHLAGWSQLLGSVDANSEVKHADRLKIMDKAAMDEVRKGLIASITAGKAHQEASVLFGQAASDRDALGSDVLKDRLGNLGRTAFRVFLCVGLMVLPVVLLWLALRRARKQVTLNARTCPRCLGVDTLETKASQQKNPLYPDARHVECLACEHQFREQYKWASRLCFPTVGYVGSGKSRWLGASYREIQLTHVPVPARLKVAPSLKEKEFLDQVVSRIVDSSSTEGTREGLAHPLTLSIEDMDRLGRNQGLVNLFDFAGELMNREYGDEVRSRALLMDGFVFFLDATQLRAGGLEAQRKALQDFYNDLRDTRKLPVGARVRVPVAVCLSRVDLLPSYHEKQDTLMPWINELRETKDVKVNLDLIRMRSRLCEEQLPILFEGWDVTRELRELFGESLMYFPISTVGLRAEGLGIDDLRQREYEPFGIFEPLLWLLHMHGYCVLE